ncbi:hypothetical protein D9M71_696770 [compost metagenome]
MPINRQVRVIPADATFRRWSVIISGLVEELGGVAEHDKTVSEAFGDPELAVIVGGQSGRYPLAEGRRTSADIDRNIQHFTAGHSDQLPLDVLQLIVQAA